MKRSPRENWQRQHYVIICQIESTDILNQSKSMKSCFQFSINEFQITPIYSSKSERKQHSHTLLCNGSVLNLTCIILCNLVFYCHRTSNSYFHNLPYRSTSAIRSSQKILEKSLLAVSPHFDSSAARRRHHLRRLR